MNDKYKAGSVWFRAYWDYERTYYKDFDFSILDKIYYRKTTGARKNETYNDVVLMLDTETSKQKHNNVVTVANSRGFNEKKYIPVTNYVVAWTLSARAYDMNLFTLYGNKPSELVDCVEKLMQHMNGKYTYIYWHNMSYDWVFVRKFFFSKMGHPDKQLNTKPHYPILLQWENGLVFRDSLILAQRSLEKWAKDLDVEHKKAVGLWDYDEIRQQDHIFNEDELTYIENDTLAGVECIDKFRKILNKQIFSMPYTATGVVREAIRKIGKENRAREAFKRLAPTYEQQLKLSMIFHGGYTHANRHIVKQIIDELVECYDFTSSYPFQMLSEKFQAEKFTPVKDMDIEEVLKNKDRFCYMFKLVLVEPKLKSYILPMPALQFSKSVSCINPIIDNGRILAADYVEIYLNEIDLEIIAEQYEYKYAKCVEVESAYKDYLPRWFTDYIYQLFVNKTKLKGVDEVQYGIAKGLLNSCYGLTVTNPMKETYEENFDSGEYELQSEDPEELYQKYLDNHNTILPYSWGVWVTSYAFNKLFKLGKCTISNEGKDFDDMNHWIYTDTDSIYTTYIDKEAITSYNNECIRKMESRGYPGVEHQGKIYYLGVAEPDGIYNQFCTQGAKRYTKRDAKTNELKITVAGVPKKGSVCLNDKIENFEPGFVFDGLITGKKTHSYLYVEDIFIDENGNEIGDSIDLTPCDYTLDSVWDDHIDDIFAEEVYIQTYEE